MPAEFDTYADAYAEQVKDPLRNRFAANSWFFDSSKLLLILDFFRRRAKATRTLSWIDLGYGRASCFVWASLTLVLSLVATGPAV